MITREDFPMYNREVFTLMDCCGMNGSCDMCMCNDCWTHKIPDYCKYCPKLDLHKPTQFFCEKCYKDIKNMCYTHFFSGVIKSRMVKKEKEDAKDKMHKYMSFWENNINKGDK